MRKSLLAMSCLSALLLVGAASFQDVPAGWPSPEAAPVAGPADGVVLPILTNTWWKLKVKAKGFTVDAEDGTLQAAKFKTTAYMFLSQPIESAPEGGGFPTYAYDMWTETDPDSWNNLYSDSIFVAGNDANGNEALMVDTFMGFEITKGTAVASTYTGKLAIKVDDEGQLKSAKLKSLAGTLLFSVLGGEVFHGSMTISGKKVDADDLPFELF